MAVAANVFLLLLIELTARLALFAVTGDGAVFAYGFDRDVRIQVFQLSRLQLAFHRDVPPIPEDATSLSPKAAAEFGKPLTVWAFGGSSVHGHHCSSAASSWPEEMSRLSSRYRVTNYGRHGTNTDFAYRQLLSALRHERPDVVLWAERPNEFDVVALGLDRNIERLRDAFPERVNNPGGALLTFAHRLHLTLYHRSFAFFLGSEFVQRAMWLLGYRAPRLNVAIEKTPREVDLAVRNYRINTLDALALAEKYDFLLVIVLLPIRDEVMAANSLDSQDPFYHRLQEVQLELAAAHSPRLRLIDTRPLHRATLGAASFFCDGVHEVKEGHEISARAVLRGLDNWFPAVTP